MNLLIKKVRVVDELSPLNGKEVDFFVDEKGILQEFSGQKISSVIDQNGLIAMSGLCDLAVNFGEPGFEHKETLDSGAKAAMAGGFTAVMQVPNNQPCIDSKEAVSYLQKRSEKLPVEFYIQAAISKKTECKSLTEVLDLVEAGASAFGDGYSNIWHSGLLLKALQYLQHTDKVLFNTPYDRNLTPYGLVHEGKVSTKNGLSGIPSIVENLAIARDLEILKYAGGNLHFSQISSSESVEQIKQAKKLGLKVTCGVNYFHLIANENSISDFDSNNKIVPPLRAETDRKALLKGIKEGIIDVIVSDHRPQDLDCKNVEFNYADFGKIGLQTLIISLKTHTDLSDQDLQRVLIQNPRKILKKEVPVIKFGEKANFFILSKEKYKFEKSEIHSLSKNTSEIDQNYEFKIIATVHGRNSYIK